MKILIGLFLMLMFAMIQDARACNSEKQSKDVEYLASIPDFTPESVQISVNLNLKTHVCSQHIDAENIDYGMYRKMEAVIIKKYTFLGYSTACLYRYSYKNAHTNSSRLLKQYSEIGYSMAE